MHEVDSLAVLLRLSGDKLSVVLQYVNVLRYLKFREGPRATKVLDKTIAADAHHGKV